MNSAIGLTYDVAILGRINLNHLLYFWAVSRAGSITGAAAVMSISQSAVSEQLRSLEQSLGTVLLERTSRGIKLTSAGERAQRYADEIIAVCGDLVRSLPLSDSHPTSPLVVGTADSVPKVIVRSILGPLLAADTVQRLVCREWRVDHLLSELALHRVDVVLTDTPVETGKSPQLSSFPVGSSEITLCAVPRLARRLKQDFPRSLNGAPILLPTESSPLRQSMDRWFRLHRLHPRIVVEADDRSQLHHFGESGFGVLPVAAITATDLKRQFGLTGIGTPRGVRDEYFAIVVEREHQHPAIALLRERLTQDSPSGARQRAKRKR
jgi:LysR family transcriptional regulator, transcriptional activator of nhaA